MCTNKMDKENIMYCHCNRRRLMYKMVRVKCFSAMMIQDNQNNELSDRQIQTSQYLATLYIAVLILSLRHQTLFFIMRNHSFPYFDQFSAWRKWHTGISGFQLLDQLQSTLKGSHINIFSSMFQCGHHCSRTCLKF